MKPISKIATAAAAALTMAAFAAPSQAAVYIGLQQAGVDGDGAGVNCVTGGICQVAAGAAGAVFFGTYGTFESELITGVDGIFPSLLASTSSDHNELQTSGGTLDIWVTRDGITGPAPALFKSVFTTNNIPTGWTVIETTYASGINAKFGGTQLATATFTSGPDTDVEFTAFAAGEGPYSLTSRYTIIAPTGGSVENTISIHAAVPEPGTWALMIAGFGGAGAMLRSRRRQAQAA